MTAKRREIPLTTCAHCGGTGSVLDHETVGGWLRGEREKRGLGLREMAAKIKVSAAYLSDLERGKRGFGGPGSVRALKAVGLHYLLD